MNKISIEFLTRPGCHLCREALPVVRRAARWAGGDVMEIDIEPSDALIREYGLRIPVVRLGGEVLAEGRIDGGVLWRRLVVRRLSRNVGS